MKTQLNEIKRMQQLAGILKENEEENIVDFCNNHFEEIEQKFSEYTGTVIQKYTTYFTLFGFIISLVDTIYETVNYENFKIFEIKIRKSSKKYGKLQISISKNIKLKFFYHPI